MDEVGAAVFGVEDHHLTPEILSDEVEWRGEVRITADEYEGLDVSRVGVAKHLGDNVDVGALLFELHRMNEFLSARYLAVHALRVYCWKPGLVFVVVAENSLDATSGGDRLEIDVLMLDGGWIMQMGLK